MAKAKKKKSGKKVEQHTPPQAGLQVPTKYLDIILPLILIIILLVLLKPMVIDGKSPQGVDVLASVGQKNQINEFYQKTGERALWNPYIFGGMPTYQRMDPVTPSVDTLIKILGRLLDNIFMFYVTGVVGMYILMRFLGMSPLISFISTAGFVLIPHYKSLWLEGHFTKFRAIMLIPWVMLTFRYFANKRSILSAALFALAFGVQIRTQHYQIIFYTGLLIFSIGLYPFIKDLILNEWGRFTKSTGLLLIAIVLAIAMAAQPLFLAREYLPYSKRGKTTISLSKPASEQEVIDRSSGVTIEYATRWSTHPSELFTWILPRFYGGMSQEIYKGDEVERLRNRAIPGYWGHMPFTQSYEYAGLLIIIFAVLGLIARRKEPLILSLAIFGAFLILLSFGRHFNTFYGIFYNNVPFFNKFRAPMMSVTVTYFIFCVLGAFGLNYLKKLSTGDHLKSYRRELIIFGLFVLIGVILWLTGFTMSFINPSRDNYNPQVLQLIKDARAEMYFNDLVRYFLILAASIGLILLYFRKKISFVLFGAGIAIILIADLVNIQYRVRKDFIDKDRIEQKYFKKSRTDGFLHSDESIFRVMPAGKLFGDNRWAYHHQTIGGYSPIKMYTIEELIENNLYQGWDRPFPINWNVLKMLNVKYVIVQGAIDQDELELVFSEPNSNLFTYRYTEHLKRGFFVGDFDVITNARERLKSLNSPEFDPVNKVILEEKPEIDVSWPDSSTVKLTNFQPNKSSYDIYTDKTSLFVISELYYPPGWKIFLNDKPVEKIFKTHHAIQSIVVPAGKHEVRLEFAPDSFKDNVNFAYFSLGVIYLSIVVGLGRRYLVKREKLDKKKA